MREVEGGQMKVLSELGGTGVPPDMQVDGTPGEKVGLWTKRTFERDR